MKKEFFEKGDKVEIIGNIPFPLKNLPKPLLGTVTQVNGLYIYVKPRYRRWVAEFYPSEIRLVQDKNIERLKHLLRNDIAGFVQRKHKLKTEELLGISNIVDSHFSKIKTVKLKLNRDE